MATSRDGSSALSTHLGAEQLNLKEILSWKARQWRANKSSLNREAMATALRQVVRKPVSDQLLDEVLAPLFPEGVTDAS